MSRVNRKRANRREDEEDRLRELLQEELGRQAELKSFDVNQFSQFNLANSVPINTISDVPQGITANSRIGDRIKVKNMSWCVGIWTDALAAPSFMYDYLRFVVFQWFPSSSTAPAISSILEAPTNYLSPYRMDTRTQYRILVDKRVSVVALTSANHKIFEGTVEFDDENCQIQYTAGTTTGYNKIYVATFSTYTGVNCKLAFNWFSKIRYYDE